jgi:hypothetical protein
MGEGKKKTRRFLAAHSHCCFCGGQVAATTVESDDLDVCFVLAPLVASS